MLSKANRLTKKEVNYLTNGKSVFMTLVSIRWIKSPVNISKFSVNVSKKVSLKAVVRNSIRRNIYRIIKDIGFESKKPIFAMFIVKKEVLKANNELLKKEIESLFIKTDY